MIKEGRMGVIIRTPPVKVTILAAAQTVDGNEESSFARSSEVVGSAKVAITKLAAQIEMDNAA